MNNILLTLPLAAVLLSLKPAPPQQTVTVRNRLDLNRERETISLPVGRLRPELRQLGPAGLVVQDAQTGAVVLSQWLDLDADGQPEELLFQTDIPAKGRRQFVLTAGTPPPAPADRTTFARFVPERTDDFAWENDRVAFRTYGPNAQELYDRKDPNGTLSSGMDCWLKRVPYPIIDKWYGRHVREKRFAYHTDVGEGYDPYHVGSSRGTGGTGVLDGGKLYVSRNFTGYQVLATGPIRTVFELSYAPWDAGGRQVRETKRISLDLGANLTRYEEHLSADQPLPNLTVGLTLHEQKGQVLADPKAGWCRYWEKIDDAYLGTGVVVAPGYLTDYQEHRSAQKDQSQLYMLTRPRAGQVVFYAGFGWQKSGQFASAEAWDAYLAQFARRLASPLEVRVK